MTSVSTTITAVTVYPDRARVTRTGTLNLEKGLNMLEVFDLPLNLNPDSVRASAQGEARARLHGVGVQRVFYTETPAENVRQLEEEIENLQDRIKRLETRQELIRQNRGYLESLASQTQTYATALASGETSLEAQLEMFAGLRSRTETLEGEILDISIEKRGLEKHYIKLKKDLERLQSARPRQRYTIQVEVEALSPGMLTLELTYVVMGAQWKPLYDLLLMDEGYETELEVNYFAQVSQKSGEEWQNVDLILSTARPALAGRPPELTPWYIAPPHPVPPPVPLPRSVQAVEMASMRAQAGDEAQALRVEKAEVAVASVETSGAALVYHVAGKALIPSDGDPHKAVIAVFRLPPKLDFVAAPKLVESVFRRVRVHNDSPFTLLPGQTNLFSGDEFLGSAFLELVPPQGEIELFLGTDDRIKVERELKRREVDKSFIGGRRRIHYAYEIKIENLLSVEAQLTLHDQIPVGRHEDIKIKLDSIEPKPVEQTGLNLLSWVLKLAPNEKRQVRFDFSIEHPQGMDVIGLP